MDILVSRARENRGNPRGYHPGQSSSAFCGAECHVDVGFLLGQSSTPFGGAHHHDHGLEDEDEDMESVEVFDESVDRFEDSSWRPMRLCAAYCSGGCARGWECTFAHGEQELHPRALS